MPDRTNRRSTKLTPLAALAAAICISAGLSGCASSSPGDKPAAALTAPALPPDPTAAIRSDTLTIPERIDVVKGVWAARNPDKPQATREQLKNIIWNASNPPAVRIAAIDILADDPLDIANANADTRESLRRRLPLEPIADVVEAICLRATKGKWTEFIGPMIRSYAKATGVEDERRPERPAIEALSGKPVLVSAFEVFATPLNPKLTGLNLDTAEKERAAAWQVLARLDRAGAQRSALLAALPASTDPLVNAVKACSSDLACIPLTDLQVKWLLELRDFDNAADGPARRAYWQASAAAISKLTTEQREQLGMRNIEAVRWASLNRPQWLGASREQLMGELRERLKTRRTYSRGEETTSEVLSVNAPRMAYGDVISALVVDEAIGAAGVGQALWTQMADDHKDTSTEWGGILLATDAQGASTAPGFRAVLFKPRASQRLSDVRFVAPEEMMHSGAWATALYHFHATKLDNVQNAGPGPGDMEFAEAQGRTGLVLTPVREGWLNADLFVHTASGGVRLDLGVITRDGERR